MVQISFTTLTAIASMLAQTALAAPSEKRAANCSFPNPSSSTNVKLSAARTIKAGESFDDQNEGVHCTGPCTIRNVWFEDVCEDAITIKQSSGTSTIVGGGAKNADDKVVQHNGGGLVKIDSYCVQDFGKLYRSCGNCSSQTKREVQISQVNAKNGKLLAGINSNYGDIATIDTKSNSYTSLKSVCDTFQGNNSGKEPTTLTKNQSNAKYVSATILPIV
ncbi:unnamed protein product [Rhizoctonia solani]|uniref:Pectate lyase n=1 Tax=Rhizoctonia solani TaxID=456999 RepID=A0A8H3BGU0_9AGAM|nr:unnamed protein product [Rhizoctonia solani]